LKQHAIVLIHGLWLNGIDMRLLRQRLEKAGYDVYQFSYPSTGRTPEENADALWTFSQTIKAPEIHYVCHSLGGLVIRHYFSLYPNGEPGRTVTLGTPHVISSAASKLHSYRLGPLLLGKSVNEGLLGNVPPWDASRELGVIAGSLAVGFGRLIPGIPRPSDGTVSVAETRLTGMTDHIVLPVSHFGLLVSRAVVRQCLHFLANGRFIH